MEEWVVIYPYSIGEFFKDIKPTSTMVEVSGLVNPEMLIEIEAYL